MSNEYEIMDGSRSRWHAAPTAVQRELCRWKLENAA